MIDRRRLLGLSSLASFGDASAAAGQGIGPNTISAAVLADAEKLTSLTFTDAQRDLMVDRVRANLECYDALRALKIPNQVAPAHYFDPVRSPCMIVSFQPE